MRRRRWDVVPGEGVGPLAFGADLAVLRSSWAAGEAFRRGGHSVDLTYQDAAGSVMVTCSPREGLYLVEIPEPHGVRYRGVKLDGKVGAVLRRLRAAGVQPVADDGGWHFADGAVGLYPSSTEPGAEVEAVTVYGPGHECGGEYVALPVGDDARSTAHRCLAVPGRGLDCVQFGQSRADVRQRMRGGFTWRHPADSREPDQDDFNEDGLVVQYDRDDLVERIFVTRADEVLLGAVNLMPAHPHTVEAVRADLEAAGHVLHHGEAALIVAGTGVEVWTARVTTQALPVCAVSLVGTGSVGQRGE
jgi:hypothetical protein